MFASFAKHGDLFKGLIMLFHSAKTGMPMRRVCDALPCVRDERHLLTLILIH